MRRRLTCTCLFLLLAFFTWSFVTIQLLRANDELTRSRARDLLRTACDSVQDAMQSLLVVYEDELRTSSERNPVNLFGAKFERLQVSLDNLHQQSSPFRNIAFEPHPNSQPINGPHLEGMHQIDICGSLAGKRIAMIGGEHIYRLHVLLLQHRGHAEGKPFPCQYHEFCTHHHICLHYPDFGNQPQPRYVKSPTAQELIDTESAVVNYIVSDTLFSARNESSWQYTSPFVDPTTGVRLRETHWLAAARKANIVILGRGPLSTPGQTYIGDWSFLRHVPEYVGEPLITVAGGYRNLRAVHVHQPVLRSPEILNAAVHLTVSRFLPDLFQLLRSIRKEVHPTKRRRLIWPSSWYRLPGRGVARDVFLCSHGHSKSQGMVRYAFSNSLPPQSPTEHFLVLQLSALLAADVTNTTLLEDPWTLLFNTQVYLQNMVLRELLPRYGIVFLPLDLPWVADVHVRRCEHTSIATDLERVGETFLTGMDYVLRYLE